MKPNFLLLCLCKQHARFFFWETQIALVPPLFSTVRTALSLSLYLYDLYTVAYTPYTLHTTVQERIHTSMPHKIRKAQADNGGAHAASIREMLSALLQQKSNSLGQDVPYRAYI